MRYGLSLFAEMIQIKYLPQALLTTSEQMLARYSELFQFCVLAQIRLQPSDALLVQKFQKSTNP